MAYTESQTQTLLPLQADSSVSLGSLGTRDACSESQTQPDIMTPHEPHERPDTPTPPRSFYPRYQHYGESGAHGPALHAQLPGLRDGDEAPEADQQAAFPQATPHPKSYTPPPPLQPPQVVVRVEVL